MRRMAALFFCLLVGCSTAPPVSKEEQAKQAKRQDWESRLKATAESTYLDDVAAATEIFSLSQQMIADLKEDSFIAGQLKDSLPLMSISKSGNGVAVVLPLKLGSTNFSKDIASLQQLQQESLARMLEPGISALAQRHLVSLKTEVRLEMWAKDGFKIKEVVESGQFDVAGIQALLKSKNIAPGQRVSRVDLLPLYTRLADSWSKYNLTPMR